MAEYRHIRDITTAEQIAGQRRAAALLGKLLELAAKKGLPPVTWTVGSAGASMAGQVSGHDDPRAAFGAWRAAIIAASGQAPDRSREHDIGDQVRLAAHWERMPVTLAAGSNVPPCVHVVLSASIWRDELPEEALDA